MKTLNRFLATAAALAITASGLSVEMPYFISFDFDAGAAPTVTDPSGALTVSPFSGGTLDADSMNAAVNAQTPASFSFDFTVDAPYTASIFSLGYNAVFEGPIGAITDVSFDLTSIGGQLLLPGVAAGQTFLPGISGITGGTVSFEVVGLGDGTVSLFDFDVFGLVSMDDSGPATVPDSSTGLLGLFAIVGLVAVRKRFNK